MSETEPILTARPISLWGDPDDPAFRQHYLVVVTFMGHKVLWHKWAVAPLMAVQTEIVDSGIRYKFYDVQTYNNRNIAGTNIKSNHAWALAVDINPKDNPMGGSHYDIPPLVVSIFRAHGFRWLGKYDPMHLEYLGLPVKEEEQDMTPDEDKLLKLNRLSHVARSHDLSIIEALVGGDLPKAMSLKSAQAAAIEAERKRLGLTLADAQGTVS